MLTKKTILLLKIILQLPFVILTKIFPFNGFKTKRIGCFNNQHLFGYYDKSPWNKSGDKMLILRIPFSSTHHKCTGSEANIELLNGDGLYLRDLGCCNIWNTQMGNRLQWMGPDFENRVIFNDYRENKLISVIKNINNNEEKVLDYPIYDVTHDGCYAITLNFLRLHAMRKGYGYDIGQADTNYKDIPDDDGLFLLDIGKNEIKLIISLRQLAEFEKINFNKMNSVRVNHVMINPSDDRFMFLFRFKIDNIEHTRLYTCSIDGKELFVFNTKKLVSHANWIDQNSFIVWADVYPYGQHYYVFNDFDQNPIRIIGKDELIEDGHPSYSGDQRYLLTDTYNDFARRRSLILYDNITNKKMTLGKYYSPFKYSGSLRCDLHPRFNYAGNKICFDACFEGQRQVYIVDL